MVTEEKKVRQSKGGRPYSIILERDNNLIEMPIFSTGKCIKKKCKFYGELGNGLCQKHWDLHQSYNEYQIHQRYRKSKQI